MNIQIHKRAQKFLDKISDIVLLWKIENVFLWLMKNTIQWTLLHQPFRKYNVRKVVVKHKNVDYRILYILKNGKIYILVVWSRENIYKNVDIRTIQWFLRG